MTPIKECLLNNRTDVKPVWLRDKLVDTYQNSEK